MFDAIKRANSLDGAAIRDALAATKEFPGVTGKVTFNENRDAVKPIVMIKIKDGGKFVVARTRAGRRRGDANRLRPAASPATGSIACCSRDRQHHRQRRKSVPQRCFAGHSQITGDNSHAVSGPLRV